MKPHYLDDDVHTIDRRLTRRLKGRLEESVVAWFYSRSMCNTIRVRLTKITVATKAVPDYESMGMVPDFR